MNSSFTYFCNVTLQLVKLYCLKSSKLWRTGNVSLVHPSLSHSIKLFSLSFLSSVFFWIFEMQFLAFLHLTSIFFFQTNPGLSFPPNLIHVWNDFTVCGLRFSSLYSFHSFNLSETKQNNSKLEENYNPKNCR